MTKNKCNEVAVSMSVYIGGLLGLGGGMTSTVFHSSAYCHTNTLHMPDVFMPLFKCIAH